MNNIDYYDEKKDYDYFLNEGIYDGKSSGKRDGKSLGIELGETVGRIAKIAEEAIELHKRGVEDDVITKSLKISQTRLEKIISEAEKMSSSEDTVENKIKNAVIEAVKDYSRYGIITLTDDWKEKRIKKRNRISLQELDNILQKANLGTSSDSNE